jgi:hypothetical protein
MYQRIVLFAAVFGLLVGLATLAPTPTADAGSNGQQLFFYVYSGSAKISWLYVNGTNQNGVKTTWSRTFSPATASYSLSGWWWKGTTYMQYRMSDGRTGACTFMMPVNQPNRDWIAIGVNRQPGNSCWVN